MPEDTNITEPQDGTNEAPETQQAEGTPETFDRAYVEKLRKEAATYRTKAKELEEQRKAEEAKRLEQAPLEEKLAALQAERDEFAKSAQEAEQRRVQAERLASLTGRVADPKAALKLLDDAHVTDDGVDVDALLKQYPFLAPNQRPSAPAAQGQPEPAGKHSRLTLEDFRGKGVEYALKHKHLLQD